MSSLFAILNNHLVGGVNRPKRPSTPSPYALDKDRVNQLLKDNETTGFNIRVMTKDEYNGEGKQQPCIVVEPTERDAAVVVALHPDLKIIKSGAFKDTKVEGVLKLPRGLVKIGSSAFSGCRRLTGELKLPKGLTEIGVLAFRGCKGLTGELILPDGLAEISVGAFQGCKGFTELNKLPKELSHISKDAFRNCIGLKGDLKLPEKLKKIGYAAFYNCTGLNGKLTLPEELTEIGGFAFSECTELTGVLKLPEKLEKIGEGAFAKCTGLTGELILPDGLAEISAGAFQGCKGFTELNKLPKELKKIGKGAFRNCIGLNGKLTLPEELTEIGEQAFRGCTGLTGVLKLPEKLEKIGEGAFQGCTGLTGVIVARRPAKARLTIGVGAFSETSVRDILHVVDQKPYIHPDSFIWSNARARGAEKAIGNSIPTLQERLKRAVITYLESGTILTKKHGGVDAYEIENVFLHLPSVDSQEAIILYRDRSEHKRLLDKAISFYRVNGLESFIALRTFTFPVLPNATQPVKLLMVGENHRSKKTGQQLLRYIMGQTVLEKKCVDLYIERGFDWRPVVNQEAGGNTQFGGNALTDISYAYPIVPRLRVHHVDTRDFIGEELERGDNMDLARIQEITRALFKVRNRNPYYIRYWPYSKTETNKAIKYYLTTNNLFRVNHRELFMMYTGSNILRLAEKGDRTVEELLTQHDKDLQKVISDSKHGVVPNRWSNHLWWLDQRELIKTVENYKSVMQDFNSSDKYKVLHQRYEKQRQRFIKTTGIDSVILDNHIRKWLTEHWRQKNVTHDIYSSLPDLFAFYRMFGKFTKRSNDNTGCPMQQRNIVYLSGAFHTVNLQDLIKRVFNIDPELSLGYNYHRTKKLDEMTKVIRETPPFELF